MAEIVRICCGNHFSYHRSCNTNDEERLQEPDLDPDVRGVIEIVRTMRRTCLNITYAHTSIYIKFAARGNL
jgi:hypothetical protein